MTDPEPGNAQLGFFEQLDISPQAEYVESTSSAFFIDQNSIDHILRLGSNTHRHRERIVAAFEEQKSTAEIADILKNLYHGGNGIGGVAAWYTEDGIRLSHGKTARYDKAAQVVSWETAAERIGQLLENGQFATNVELTEAQSYEHSRLADNLLNLYYDFSDAAKSAGYLPSLAKNPARGYPEESAWLAEQLDSPEFRQSLAEEYAAFQSAYRENPNLLRFHHHKLQEISDNLHDLSLPRTAFSSAMTEIPMPQQFITEDEIDAAMSSGSGIAGGKDRIFAFFQEKHTEKEKVDFLRQEYGIGGHSHALSGAMGSSEDHSGKGMHYKKDGCPDVRLTWSQVARRIEGMVRQERYYTADMDAYKSDHLEDAELEDWEKVDPEDLRQRFAAYGIVDGELVDEDKLNAHPFIQQVMADAERLAAPTEENVQTGLPSPALTAPPAPLPVGRIDFLATNGSVGESVEYTDAEEFVAAIKEENYFGAPMRIVLYRDSESQTIPQDFLKELDPPPQGFEIIDMAQAHVEWAKWLINAYCQDVFEEEADFSDLSQVPLAFSSTSDSAHTIEVTADLISYRLRYLVDGEVSASVQCADLRNLSEFLANLDFDEIVAFAETEYIKHRQESEVHTDKVTEIHQMEQPDTEKVQEYLSDQELSPAPFTPQHMARVYGHRQLYRHGHQPVRHRLCGDSQLSWRGHAHKSRCDHLYRRLFQRRPRAGPAHRGGPSAAAGHGTGCSAGETGSRGIQAQHIPLGAAPASRGPRRSGRCRILWL